MICTRRRRKPFAVALSLVTLLAASAPAGAGTPRRELSPKITVTGRRLAPSDDVGKGADPAIGKKAPTLGGRGFDGQKVTIINDGKPRLILFLAHWCPHCQAEVPRIVKLAKQGKLDAVEVDTVTTNTSSDAPNYPPSRWLEREHWPFSPVLADDSHSRALLAFGGDSFPFFVFVRADGTIAARASGELAPAVIAAAAKNLAAGRSLFQKS